MIARLPGVLAVVALALFGPGPAAGGPRQASPPLQTATVDPGSGPPGSTITIHGQALNTYKGAPTSELQVNAGSVQFSVGGVVIHTVSPSSVTVTLAPDFPAGPVKLFVVTYPAPASAVSLARRPGEKSGYTFTLPGAPPSPAAPQVNAVVTFTCVKPPAPRARPPAPHGAQRRPR